MIPLGLQIVIAVLLDLFFGDPRWFPHPVRLLGRLAALVESTFRRLLPAKLAGICAVGGVLGLTGSAVYLLLHFGLLIHPLLPDLLSIAMLYTTIAARDLVRHSSQVHEALEKNDLPAARSRVAMMVGRDTENLDRGEIARAAVESVAENMVDGVTAPLFFAALGGPILALLYKAVNTMDSMFGYKNEQYLRFGWAAARLDDAVNFIPARLTAAFVPVAALFLGYEAKKSWRILRRDRLQHSSPNSGHTEAAVAGALDVRLGGPSFYFKTLVQKPFIGDDVRRIEPDHIIQANRLMLLTSALFLLALLLVFFC